MATHKQMAAKYILTDRLRAHFDTVDSTQFRNMMSNALKEGNQNPTYRPEAERLFVPFIPRTFMDIRTKPLKIGGGGQNNVLVPLFEQHQLYVHMVKHTSQAMEKILGERVPVDINRILTSPACTWTPDEFRSSGSGEGDPELRKKELESILKWYDYPDPFVHQCVTYLLNLWSERYRPFHCTWDDVLNADIEGMFDEYMETL